MQDKLKDNLLKAPKEVESCGINEKLNILSLYLFGLKHSKYCLSTFWGTETSVTTVFIDKTLRKQGKRLATAEKPVSISFTHGFGVSIGWNVQPAR